MLLACNVFAQDSTPQGTSKPTAQDNPFEFEIWNYPGLDRLHPLLQPRNRPSSVGVEKEVRVIYLVPSDKIIRDEYKAGIADAFTVLQRFYQSQLANNNRTFSLHSPIVEVYQTSHTANWYVTNNPGSGSSSFFYLNTLADGFALTGGQSDDPNYRWVFYIDSDPACNQIIGSNAGWSIMAANDLRGLARQQNIPSCVGQPPDNAGMYRWIGGAGHELGHAFLLPHPAGCPSCGEPAASSIMWVGYALFPNTYFLTEDKAHLLSLFPSFFISQNLAPPIDVDFGADGKSDISIWRPSDGTWHVLESTGGYQSKNWGLDGDILVPGDYDRDKRIDHAVWRPASGTWYISKSSNGTVVGMQFGQNGDVPVPGDYDGDGVSDFAVWRPSSGYWYILRSSTSTLIAQQFGLSTDLPVASDYNGDQRTDVAVWRPSNGIWYIYNSFTATVTYVPFGAAGDRLVPGDYDGDKKSDVAVWRPSDGNWYVRRSSNGSLLATHFGASGDKPVPGDYDGDGLIDFSVWRPGDTNFYILRSSDNSLVNMQWGLSSDIPIASAVVR